MHPKIVRQSNLAWKTVVVLPSVTEQHGEGHFVSGAQFFRSEQEIGNLGEALGGNYVSALEHDVSVLENFADVAPACIFHQGIVTDCGECDVSYPLPRFATLRLLLPGSRENPFALAHRRVDRSIVPAMG